ncbi:hypothetical protein IMZ31_22580 (plasmid) [Pontibacillus sp. ALD_SL1]|uniref:hypothetical protein n=1 Tax=Pontibacillus sp. ALD_SL1 TaxID=2777185 RepID=UPI001A959E96|nr:hypothetical protein [Pontibacillus sp. ALD_SL1]QST02243.1 hypothetical protein IMZ31_22580 [Pontibacillus sp. ALD_SL1]
MYIISVTEKFDGEFATGIEAVVEENAVIGTFKDIVKNKKAIMLQVLQENDEDKEYEIHGAWNDYYTCYRLSEMNDWNGFEFDITITRVEGDKKEKIMLDAS